MKKLDLPLEKIRHWAEQGWSLSEMAREVGCSVGPIYNLMVKEGIPRLPAKARQHKNHFWKGGKTIDRDGYVLIKANAHPHRNHLGYVREHRLIMEGLIGRFLLPSEVVDHIDGVRGNNDPKNLRLFASNADHLRHALKGKVPKWTQDGRRRIIEAHQEWCRQQREKKVGANPSRSGIDVDPLL